MFCKFRAWLRRVFSCEKAGPSDRLILVRVEDLDTGLTTEGDIRAMKIKDSERCTIEFGAPVDKRGKPAKVQPGSVRWSIGDSAVATVEQDPTNPLKATVTGIAPNEDGEGTVINIEADADLGDGVKSISGVEPLVVTSGEAVGFGPASLGTPEEQPS